VHYRRTRRLDIPLITDIKILAEHDTPSPFSASWNKVAKPVSPRGRKLYLWYLTGKTLSEMSIEEKQNLITEIDVTYGDDVPWYGFERIQPAAAERDASKGFESVSLTIRRGVTRASICNAASPIHSVDAHRGSQIFPRQLPFIFRTTAILRSCK
jgi:hypothetical protein